MSERRKAWILVVALLGQLVLLTAQIPDAGGQRSYFEGIVLRVVAPPARWVHHFVAGVRDLWHGVESRRELEAENLRLQEEVDRLRQEQVRLSRLDLEVKRLSQALDYVAAQEAEIRVADVVYIDHVSWLRTLIVDAEGPGVGLNQPVTDVRGLVGRTILRAGRYARVQLITDRASSVGAMIERTRRQGIIRGSGDGTLALDYVSLQADVQPGDRVVTAGIDGVYPRGIPIGTVVFVDSEAELFHRIQVHPVVDFGLLDQVYIRLREPLFEEIQEEELHARP